MLFEPVHLNNYFQRLFPGSFAVCTGPELLQLLINLVFMSEIGVQQ